MNEKCKAFELSDEEMEQVSGGAESSDSRLSKNCTFPDHRKEEKCEREPSGFSFTFNTATFQNFFEVLKSGLERGKILF